jgi:hypothetical protein
MFLLSIARQSLLKTPFSVDVLLIGTALIFLFEKGIRAYRDWDTRL